ncbi:MAG: zinc ABC transporter substrate-binding protein [Rhodospirillales bacterium]
MRHLRSLVLLVGIVSGLSVPALAGSPNVVVSIAPLHSLAAGVMKGAGEPVMLVPAGASPHAFALRPSDAIALQKARLVVLAGAGLERFLDRPLTALSGRAEILKLAALPGMRLRELGEHHAHDGHGGEHHDPHIWLDPENAITIVAALRDSLGALDPENAALYRQNASAMIAALGALDREIAQLLIPVRSRPFITFHDAYGYFADRYSLSQVGTVVLSPDIPPGAARVAEIVRLVRERKAVCVFSEPQFEPRLITRLAEDNKIGIGVADPLGAGIPEGPDHYAATLRALAGTFRDCLAGAGAS